MWDFFFNARVLLSSTRPLHCGPHGAAWEGQLAGKEQTFVLRMESCIAKSYCLLKIAGVDEALASTELPMEPA